MARSLRTENGRPGLASTSVVPTPLLNRAYHLNICARDKQLSPYTYLIISTVSAAVFPEFKTEFNVRFSAPCRYCDHVLSLPAQHGAVFPVMLSVSALRCCQITDEVWAHGWHALHHRWHFYLGQNKIICII